MTDLDDPEERTTELAAKVVDTDASLTDEEARDLIAVLRTEEAEAVHEDAAVALWCSGFMPPDPVSEAVPALVDVARDGTDRARAHALLLLGMVAPTDPTAGDPVVEDLAEKRAALLALLEDVGGLDEGGTISPREGLVLSLASVATVRDGVRDELAARFDAEDPAVRAAAVDALANGPGLPGDPGVVATLVDDPDPAVREAALWAIQRTHEGDAVPGDRIDAVAGRLDDGDGDVREAARSALAAFLADDAVWARFRENLTADDESARRNAYGVVRHRMGVESANRGEMDEFVATVADVYDFDPEVELADDRLAAVLDPLVDAVERRDPAQGPEAAEMLGYLAVGFDDPGAHEEEIADAIDALVDAVVDRDGSSTPADDPGSAADEPTTPADDPAPPADDPATAVAAASATALGFALAGVHDPAAFEERILDGADALLSAARPGDGGTAPLPVRRSAVEAAGDLVDAYDPLARPVGSGLLDLLDADDPDVLVGALAALDDAVTEESGLAVAGFESLLDCAAHEDPEVAAASLGILDDRAVESGLVVVADDLAAAMDRSDPDVLEGAASALARAASADPDAVRPHVDDLAALLTDDSVAVEPGSLNKGAPAEAAQALSHVAEDDPEVTEAVVDRLRESLTGGDGDEALRAAALVPELVDFASPSVERERREALLGDLADLATDGDGETREVATDVLRGVLGSIETRRRYADDDEVPDEPSPALLSVREAIGRALDDGYGDVRWNAARAAAEFAGAFPEASLELVDPVFAALDDSDLGRHAAGGALDYVSAAADHDPSAFVDRVPVLDAYLTHEDDTVRSSAASALASVAEDHGAAVEPAARHLRECLDDEWTRDEALEALSLMARDVPTAVAPVGPVFVEVLGGDGSDDADDEGFGADRADTHAGEMLGDLEGLFDDMSRAFLDLYAARGVAGLSISEPEAVELPDGGVATAADRLAERVAGGARGELLSSDGDEAADRLVRRWAMFGLANLARHYPEEMQRHRETFAEYVDADASFVRGNALRGVAWTATPETAADFEDRFVELLDADQPIYRRAGVVGLGRLEARNHLTAIKRLERTDDSETVTSAADAVVEYLDGSADNITVDVDDGADVGVFVPDDADEKYSL